MKRLAMALLVIAVLVGAIFYFSLTANAQTGLDDSSFNVTWTPEPTSIPMPIEPTSTPTETPTPIPTPTPTPKIVPGSPLSIGSTTFEELLSQLDIMSLAELVLIALGIMWAIIILVTVAKRVIEKVTSKTQNQA